MVSIIVPVFGDVKLLNRFLLSLTKQTIKDFNLVLVIDTNFENVLGAIESHETLRDKTSIIYNSKRAGRINAIKSGIKIATGNYVVVWSSSTILEKNSLEKLNNLIDNSNNADIIEFNAKFKGPFKLKGTVRKEFFSKTNISSNPEIIAYSYPLEFNKVFKKEILEKSLKYQNANHVNSMFAMEHIYKILLTSKTYAAYNENIIVKTMSNEINKLNIDAIIEQWTYIRKFLEYTNLEDTFKYEIDYAEYFHLLIIVLNLVKKMNGTAVKNRFLKYIISTIEGRFKNFFKTNNYILRNEKESMLIQKNIELLEIEANLKEIKKCN